MFFRNSRSIALFCVLALSGCRHNPLASVIPPEAPAGALMLWPAPKDALPHIKQAGLQESQSDENPAYHIHIHLDVFKDGTQVVVPAGIGIDDKASSPLHTHLAAGVIHIEAAKPADYTLGQFFTEWGVPLADAKAYVNGVQAPDATAVKLQDQQEIAVVFGSPPAKIPTDLYGN